MKVKSKVKSGSSYAVGVRPSDVLKYMVTVEPNPRS